MNDTRLDTQRPASIAEEIGLNRPMTSRELEAHLNLVRTYEQFSGEFDQLFKEHGLSSPQFNVLRILRGHGEPLPVYQVAERMVTREPDITRLVDRLEAAGLVERERCVKDRRVIWVKITKTGRQVLRTLDKPVAALHRKQLGHLGAAKLQALSELLFECRHPKS